jgi:hypothetical protein
MSSFRMTDKDSERVQLLIPDMSKVTGVSQQWASHGRNIVSVSIYLDSGQTLTCDMDTATFDDFISKLGASA